jgi:hypothetical protein
MPPRPKMLHAALQQSQTTPAKEPLLLDARKTLSALGKNVLRCICRRIYLGDQNAFSFFSLQHFFAIALFPFFLGMKTEDQF